MKTRNLLEIEHPALPWLLLPAFLGALLAFCALLASSPVAAAVVAVVIAALLWCAFVRMGRRS